MVRITRPVSICTGTIELALAGMRVVASAEIPSDEPMKARRDKATNVGPRGWISLTSICYLRNAESPSRLGVPRLVPTFGQRALRSGILHAVYLA
jgi:hypothetical protein